MKVSNMLILTYYTSFVQPIPHSQHVAPNVPLNVAKGFIFKNFKVIIFFEKQVLPILFTFFSHKKHASYYCEKGFPRIQKVSIKREISRHFTRQLVVSISTRRTFKNGTVRRTFKYGNVVLQTRTCQTVLFIVFGDSTLTHTHKHRHLQLFLPLTHTHTHTHKHT